MKIAKCVFVSFFVKDLKMDKAEVDRIKIVRCHRLNKAEERKIRTIIDRFHFHGDRENVKKEDSI